MSLSFLFVIKSNVQKKKYFIAKFQQQIFSKDCYTYIYIFSENLCRTTVFNWSYDWLDASFSTTAFNRPLGVDFLDDDAFGMFVFRELDVLLLPIIDDGEFSNNEESVVSRDCICCNCCNAVEGFMREFNTGFRISFEDA